jgi:ABC-2 type transport system ATP-binding protein
MYVTEYLEFIAGLHKIQNKKKRINEIIDLTGLGPEKHKKIGALSKGYRQRVGLGQALIHDPKVLILDEPTSGLDPNQLSEIRSLIANAGKEKTVILSTHIMQEVEAMCKRVVIIDQGKIVTDRPIEQLQNSGQHRIIRVEFSVPVIAQLLEQIDGVERIIPTEKPHIFQLVSKENVDIRSHVFHFAVKHNIEVLSMQILTEKLEDLFRSLTK